ncbi:hypothetical protein X975_02308, partial [Stegodyphus mimosarum]
MPKSKKSVAAQKVKETPNKEMKSAGKGAVFLLNAKEIAIKIHAKPGAKESLITDVGTEAVGIQIAAPPVDGEANKELIRYLAEVLNLKKSEIMLQKGSRSKEKTVTICEAASSIDSIIEKLKAISKQ